MRFKCIHNCQLHGAVVKKGTLVSADADQLKLPAYAPLLSPASFIADDEVQAPAPEPLKVSAREDLLRRCADLKLTPPKNATNVQLADLIAEAADPEGSPTP